MSDAYRQWVALQDALDDGEPLTEVQQRLYEQLAQSDEGAMLERHLRAELRNFARGENDLMDRAVADAALTAFRSQDDSNVVPLRPGTAPPTEHADDTSRRRKYWGVASLTGALAAAAVLFTIELPSDGERQAAPPPAHAPVPWSLALSAGEVSVGQDSEPLSGNQLQLGDRVSTREGTACFRLEGLVSACLDRDSSIVVVDPSDGYGLEVERGRLVVSVSPMPTNVRFNLSSRGLFATALGTLYALEVDADGKRVVGVIEGRVQVAGAGETRIVGPGQEVVVSDVTGQPGPLTAARAQRYQSLLSQQRLWSVDGTAVHVKSDPGGAEIHVDGELIGESPASVVLAAGKHDLRVELEGYVTAQRSLSLLPGQRDSFQPFTLDAVQSNSGEAPKPAPTAAAPPSPAELLRTARAQVTQGSWVEAAATYRKLRALHPRSAEARTVLVALGQLELDRLSNPEAARRSFSAYLASGGVLAQEARFGNIRALRRLGARQAELAAIDEYLQHHPGGVDAPNLQKRAAALRSSLKKK